MLATFKHPRYCSTTLFVMSPGYVGLKMLLEKLFPGCRNQFPAERDRGLNPPFSTLPLCGCRANSSVLNCDRSLCYLRCCMHVLACVRVCMHACL